MKHNRSEKGQILIIMTIGMVVFLGFVALALDGGTVYTDRRAAQNNADMVALAGASVAALSMENSGVTSSGWNCADSRVVDAQNAAIQAAIARASANGAVLDTDVTDRNGVYISDCGRRETYEGGEGYLEITAEISTTSQTNFIQVFSGGAIHNNVRAITRIYSRTPVAAGNAIIALNPANCSGQTNGATYHGGGNQNVQGAGIWTNGCLRFSGNPYINVTEGEVTYVSELFGNGASNPPPTQSSHVMDLEAYYIPAPNCSDPAAHTVDSLPATLAPGLWCLNGDLPTKVTGDDVTIYLKGNNLKHSWNSNGEIHLTAPGRSPDPSPAVPGLLFYMDPNNPSSLKINGTISVDMEGTLYMPGADLTLLGTADTIADHCQIIAWNVEVGGNTANNVTFSAQEQFQRPTRVDLFK